jgi:polyhydroxyalkanoate synthesis regulator phasin
VAAPAPRPRATKPRASAPIGPALSDSTQTRMREMSERLQAVRQQLADLQNKKRPARAARRTP